MRDEKTEQKLHLADTFTTFIDINSFELCSNKTVKQSKGTS